MVTPGRYDTEFRRLDIPVSTDVQDFIDAIIAEILALADPWILVSGSEYRTPTPDPSVSADQRFFSIDFTRISQTRLGWETKDQNGATIEDGAIDIVGGSASAVILVGTRHACMEIVGSSSESAWTTILDTSPYKIDSVGSYVIHNAHRNAAGALRGDQSLEAIMNEDSPGMDSRIGGYRQLAGTLTERTTAGGVMPLPCEVSAEASSTEDRAVGKLFQMIIVPSDLAVSSVLTDVALGSDLSGSFYILDKGSSSSNPGHIAVRSA